MRVIETTLDEDLSLLSRFLWQQRVAHRIFEERGAQVVEVADPAQRDVVRQAYEAWRDGRLTLRAQPAPAAARRRRGIMAAVARYPGLSALVVLACVVFPFSLPLADGRLTEVAGWLTIVDPRQPLPANLAGLLAQAEVWRWFTPMLLHFSVLHLAFNCAVTIELGRRIEGVLGAGGWWLLVLLLAGASNLTQFALGASAAFGGLSGVAYGLLGFVLVSARRQPDQPAWRLPAGVALGLLLFLVLFTTGVTEPFGLRIANAAHWSGLAAGALLALMRPLGAVDPGPGGSNDPPPAGS